MRRYLSTLTILSLILVPALAFGAIKLPKSNFAEKGKFHIGFAGDVWSSMTPTVEVDGKENKGDSTSHIGINPFVGYFVMRGLEVGGIIEFNSMSWKANDKDYSASSFGLGPQVAYFYKITPIFMIYVQGNLVYYVSKSNDAQEDVDLGGWKLAGGAGVGVPVGGKIAGGVFQIGLDYRYEKETAEANKVETVTTTTGPAIVARMSLYF